MNWRGSVRHHGDCQAAQCRGDVFDPYCGVCWCLWWIGAPGEWLDDDPTSWEAEGDATTLILAEMERARKILRERGLYDG